LILIYNQLRILFLVVFNIPPEHPMHEVLGLLGLGLYVFAPLWFLGGWFSGMLVEGDGTRIWRIGRIFSDWFLGIRAERDGTRIGRIWRIFTDWFLGIRAEMDGTRITRIGRIFADLFSGVSGADGVFRKGVQVVLIGFLGFFALVSVQKEPMRHAALESLVPVGLPEHCSRETLKDGVVKYRSDGLLIYVKPIQGWYDTEHTPLICWQGSGYEFGQIREQIIGKTTLYTGILEQKGVTPLYTAWWFDNGQEQTISQARWRWLDAGGATGFSLLNVTADTPGQLQQQLTRMIHD
jgi:hypothetical protein